MSVAALSVAVLSLAALSLTAVLAGSAAATSAVSKDSGSTSPTVTVTAKSKHCRRVNVRFEPDGEGGAIKIRARNVGCRKARSVVRQCIKGTVSSGWTASVNSDYTRITLRSGDRTITFMPVGGGGCVPI